MRINVKNKPKVGDTITGTKFLLIPRVIETNGSKNLVWLERVRYEGVYKCYSCWDNECEWYYKYFLID